MNLKKRVDKLESALNTGESLSLAERLRDARERRERGEVRTKSDNLGNSKLAQRIREGRERVQAMRQGAEKENVRRIHNDD
jgi:hypothetical protein